MLVVSLRGVNQFKDSGLTKRADHETPPLLALKVSSRVHSRNNNKNPLVSVLRIDFRRSLKSGLLVQARNW